MELSAFPGSAPAPEAWRAWHWPLSRDGATLGEARTDLARVGARQEEIPFLVQLAENPKYGLFRGAVDLVTHDCIHLVLGRGLLPKDEAFVIGFTMGSTHRLGPTEETLFTLVAKRLYPGIYRFDDDDVRVFRDAVRLVFVSDCRALDAVDYAALADRKLREIRAELGLDAALLWAYYAIEKRRYPQAVESRRLLD